ncbi:MAG: SpoIIE family protein phosphatase [Lachnospiraceae bacterium]|nr:SpoIIE family protein phosphatase [Lachnospiraceae bacterium]
MEKRSTVKQNNSRSTYCLFMVSMLCLLGGVVYLLGGKILVEIRDSFSRVEKQAADISHYDMEVVTDYYLNVRSVDYAARMESRLTDYQTLASGIAEFVEELYREEIVGEGDVSFASAENEGRFTLQLILPNNIAKDDPVILQEAKRVALVEGIMESFRSTHEELTAQFVCLENGVCLVGDHDSGERVRKDGRPLRMDMRRSEWYQKVKKTGDVAFALSTEIHNKEFAITLAAPIFDDGDFRGVAAVSISLTSFARIINTYIGSQSLNYCIFKGDKLLFSEKSKDHLLRFNAKNLVAYQDNVRPEVVELIKKAGNGQQGIHKMTMGDSMTWFGYAPIGDYGLTMLAFREESEMMEQTSVLLKNIRKISQESMQSFYLLSAIGLCLFFVLAIAVMRAGRRVTRQSSEKMVEPLLLLNEKVDRLQGDNLNFSWEEQADVEIEQLAEAFAQLTDQLNYYIADTTRIAAERERMETEMDVARRIQRSVMPLDYVERDGLSLFAALDSSKEIGGDFYDILFLDDHHVAVVIADVSGEGVPAALFMMMTKLFIDGTAISTPSVEDIFFKVNNQLCKDNEIAMFATAWMGLINTRTGHVKAVNAGHNPPIYRKAGGEFVLTKIDHNFVLGGITDIEYEPYEFYLGKGDSLFLYTDGCLDVFNSDLQCFGTGRMLDALNADPDATPENLIGSVFVGMAAYAGDFVQKDDITMLALRWFGQED